MQNLTYNNYSIQPRPAGAAGVIAFVVQGSRMVAYLVQPAESSAVEAAKCWIDALDTLSVSPSAALPVPVAEGGTGAVTASSARANLGAAPTVAPVFTGTLTFGDFVASPGSRVDGYVEVKNSDGVTRQILVRAS